MTISQLTSKDNPLIKTIRLVSSDSRRAPKGWVVAEGIRVLEEVSRAGREIEAVVFSESFGSSEREKRLLKAWQSTSARLYRVTEKLFDFLSDVRTPQGALALVKIPEVSLSAVSSSSNALILYACGIQDPGNLGTLIRTAAAAGVTLVCTAKDTVSARNSKSIRSSAGAFFNIPMVEHVDAFEFHNYCARNLIRLYRTDAHQGVPYEHADLKSSCAILLGNEGSGMVQDEFVALPSIHIPMANSIESLNVAAAGAVILFEASRQRATEYVIHSGLPDKIGKT